MLFQGAALHFGSAVIGQIIIHLLGNTVDKQIWLPMVYFKIQNAIQSSLKHI